MQEIWKDIPGYEGYYQASNLGRIKRLERVLFRNNGHSEKAKFTLPERIKKIQKQTQGYSQVVLFRDGAWKTHRLNVLIAKMFVPNPQGKPFVNHIDGNKENNSAENLEWVTGSENILHAYRTGLLTHYETPVVQISKTGEILREFRNIKEAAESVNGSKGNICMVCKGKRKNAYGFVWKYK